LVIRLLLWLLSFQAMAGQLPAPNHMLITHLDHPDAKPYIALLRRAYDDLNVTTSFEALPITRRIQAVDDGVVDGVMATIRSITQQYPNLLPIEPALATFELSLICVRADSCEVSLLDDKEVVFHASRGSIRALEGELHIHAPHNIYVIEDHVRLIEMLRFGRVQYLIHNTAINNEPIMHLQAYQHVPLGRYSVYHAIHRKHEALATPLSNAIKSNLAALSTFSIQEKN